MWTNNAWIAALCITLGGFFGLPVICLQFQNAVNVGRRRRADGGARKLGLFFGLILPHGLLELTAVWIAGGVGLGSGGPSSTPARVAGARPLPPRARAAIVVALGLVLVLFVSGLLEAFVTPSPLPTWARIAIGVFVWSVCSSPGSRSMAGGPYDGRTPATSTRSSVSTCCRSPAELRAVRLPSAPGRCPPGWGQQVRRGVDDLDPQARARP